MLFLGAAGAISTDTGPLPLQRASDRVPLESECEAPKDDSQDDAEDDSQDDADEVLPDRVGLETEV